MLAEVGIIPLSQGYEAIVDAADYAELSRFLWHVRIARRTPDSIPHLHAARTEHTPDGPVQVYMHRSIMGATADQQVDHRNHYGLDNRRANLRFCSRSENNANALRSRNQRRGVVCTEGRFYAVLQKGGRRFNSRRCYSAEEAARAYDAMAREHHGAFAVLNYPDEQPEPSNDNQSEQPGGTVA